MNGSAVKVSRSIVLATLALLIWIASLVAIGMTFHNGFRLHGYKILVIGWQGPLQGAFAWFANPLFLFSMLWLYVRERAWVAVIGSLLAFAVALDTFRFDALRLNANANETSVYGFGLGAVLWFVAMAVAIVAAGTYLKEERIRRRQTAWTADGLRCLGVALAVIVAMTSLRLYLLDRRHPNDAEREYLKDVVFRMGQVCTAEPEGIAEPLRALQGPLEVVVGLSSGLGHGWADSLLKWGAPAIRVEGRDYWAETRDGERVVVSVPSEGRGDSGATLLVEGRHKDGRAGYQLTLREGRAGRVIFSRAWRQETSNGRFCPAFDPYGVRGGQPRQLVQTALGLPDKAPAPILPRVALVRPVHRAVVVPQGEGPLPGNADPEAPDTGTKTDRTAVRNCPTDIRWANRGGNDGSLLRLGEDAALRIGNAVYFTAEQGGWIEAICENRRLYMFKAMAGSGKLEIWLTERGLQDFRRLRQVNMWAEHPAFTGDGWKILDLRDDGRELTLVLYSYRTKARYIVRTAVTE